MIFLVMMALLFASVQGQSQSATPSGSVSLQSASGTGSVPSASQSFIPPSASASFIPPSSSPSNSGTFPLPPPATTLTNLCPRPDLTNHITYLCPTWVDASGLATSWTISANGGPAITVTSPFAVLGNYPGLNNPSAALAGSTVYTFTIIQIDSAGRQSLPYIATLTTSASDAKTNYQVNDLQNVTCTIGTSNSTLRPYISCSWGQATPTAPIRVVVRARCVSPQFVKNKFIKKDISGTTLSVALLVNRAQSVCTVDISGRYPGHSAAHHRGHLFRKVCLVGSATLCS